MAHAEASARTVDAAVTAAAAQLDLRSDQVDVEVLEEPVPSTFGYIGTPARVRVTPRETGTGVGVGAGAGVESGGSAAADRGMVTGKSESVGAGTGSAVGGSESVGAGTGSVVGGSEPVPVETEAPSSDRPSAQKPSTEANVSNEAGAAATLDSAGAAPAVPHQTPAAADETGNGQVPTDHESSAADQAAVQSQEGPINSPSATESATSLTGVPVAAPDGAAPDTHASPAASPAPVGSNASLPSSSPPSGPTVDAAGDATPDSGPGQRSTRPPRRTYKDEPIEPQMVEEDTERAGDFLEGLLDALDVDGDITTWVDEVGGHIDLEGTDLDVLVGSNGETLDSLQELTRLAVLRRSKRRVRLLIDINGFRARQREQLTSMVQATVEQVIRTREDHEFQPMTPAERKVVHDAVAAMEGVVTESLGEEPNRRVVIRPT